MSGTVGGVGMLSSRRSETQSIGALNHVLGNVRGGHDLGTGNEVGLGDAARLCTCTTGPDRAAVFDVRTHQLGKGLHPFLVDSIGVATRGVPHALSGEQYDRFLVGSDRDVSKNE